MINLITGKTGNGKSLYAITEIEKRRISENRQVFYNGIPDLKLDWIEFENARNWFNLPQGSIIVIDEARAAFPVRPNASTVPEYVSAFEIHRKQGYDIYILTQQPSFIDAHIRKLTDVHYHLMRVFGQEKAIVHKWFTCKDNCHTDRAGSITSDFTYPKDNYGKYKSAELHTIKPQVPFRYYLKFILPVVVVVLAIFAYYAFKDATHQVDDKIQAEKKSLETPQSHSGTITKLDEMDPNYFYVMNTPRVKNLPYTAPKYDEITEPKKAPYPAACVKMGERCQCYTQQGTKLDTDKLMCEQIVNNGFFLDFDAGDDNQKNNTAGDNPAPLVAPT